MAMHEKMLSIGDGTLPASWAAPASYALVRTGMPYLLVVTDRKDGMLEMLLFHRSEQNAELVAESPAS